MQPVNAVHPAACVIYCKAQKSIVIDPLEGPWENLPGIDRSGSEKRAGHHLPLQALEPGAAA